MPTPPLPKGYSIVGDGGSAPPLPSGYQLVDAPPAPQEVSRFALGPTSISANPLPGRILRSISQYLPDIFEIGGGALAAGGVLAGSKNPASASIAGAKGMVIGRAGGEAVRQEIMNLIRPNWMESPSAGENLSNIGSAGVQGGVNAATGLVSSGIANILFSPSRTIPLQSAATKLARALPLQSEERAFITKAQKGIGDIKGTAQLNGIKITDAASLERAASSTVRSLDDDVSQFFAPYNKYPKNFYIDGGEISRSIKNNVPADLLRQAPRAAANIAKTADNYVGNIGFEEAREIWKNKNAALHAYEKLAPAEKYRADLKRQAMIDTAVVDSIRDQMYSKIEKLAGPGARDLMERTGAAISIRDYAHKLADDQAVQGGFLAKIIPHYPSTMGAASQALRFWESSNNLIKRAFEEAPYATARPMPQNPKIAGLLAGGKTNLPGPTYTTGIPQGPGGTVGYNLPATEPPFSETYRSERVGPLAGLGTGKRQFSEPAINIEGSPKRNLTFSLADLEALRKQGMEEAKQNIIDKRVVSPRAGELRGSGYSVLNQILKSKGNINSIPAQDYNQLINEIGGLSSDQWEAFKDQLEFLGMGIKRNIPKK